MTGVPDFVKVARHEAAHAVALDALGGHFHRVTFTERTTQDGKRAYSGGVWAPRGSAITLLTTSVAGAVADTESKAESMLSCSDWRPALRELVTADGCSEDFATAKLLAAELDAGSVAETAIKSAIHAVVQGRRLIDAVAYALLHVPWEYSSAQARTKTLAWHRPSVYSGIPGCPPEWDDFVTIKNHVTRVAEGRAA